MMLLQYNPRQRLAQIKVVDLLIGSNMDRQAFLSSLPFLLPCPSAAWPPCCTSASSSASTTDQRRGEPCTKMETLLVPADSSYKFKLSVEPSVELSEEAGLVQKIEEIKPAFFACPKTTSFGGRSSQASFDPAMADIQAVLESSIGPSFARSDNHDDASVLKGRVLFTGSSLNPTQSSLKSQTPASLHSRSPPQSIHQKPDARPLYLYFKIDKNGVFQVDGKQLVTMEIVPAENGLPPSLVLLFSCCVLRIFPLYTPSPTKPASDSDTPRNEEWKTCALEALQTLEEHLHKLMLNSSSAAAWSPCTSSLPSSNEAGQRDAAYFPRDGGKRHSHSSSTGSNSSPHQRKKAKGIPSDGKVALQDQKSVQKVRRKVQALSRCRAGLQVLEYVLESPVTVAAVVTPPTLHGGDGDGDCEMPLTDSAASDTALPKTQLQGHLANHSKPAKHSLVPLLSGITEDLTAAFSNQAEQQEVLILCRQEIDEMRNRRIDDLLDSFFPNMPHHQSSDSRKNHRAATSGRSNSARKDVTSEGEETKHKKSAQSVLNSVKCLLNEQQALVKERNSYMTLPTRG
jgi:hypothetical protein